MDCLLTTAVAAGLIFGATRRSGNQTYTHGGGDISDGSAPRSQQQLAGLQPYADAGILREYCQPRDPICAPQSKDLLMNFHLDYFDKWGTEAADWVVSKAREADGQASTGGPKMSGAGRTLHTTITHPVAYIFMLVVVLFGL